MRPSLILLAALCLATLGLRLAGAGTDPRADQDRFQQDLASRLRAQGFATHLIAGPPLRYVEAENSGCTLRAAAEIWHGARQTAFAELAPGLGATTIYYRGWVDEYPRVQPLLAQYVQRHLAGYGIGIAISPVILVSAGPGCDLSALYLAGLRMHSVE